jgi:hypothetical protein
MSKKRPSPRVRSSRKGHMSKEDKKEEQVAPTPEEIDELKAVEELEAEEAEEPTEEQPEIEPVPEVEASVLEATCKEIEQGAAMLGTLAADSALRPALAEGLRELAQKSVNQVETYGRLITEVQEQTRTARKKEGSDGLHGIRVVPVALAPILGEMVAQGKRPHAACSFCQHEPEGGVTIFPDKSKEAALLAQEALSRFPAQMMVIVGSGLNGNPFETKRARGGGGGGGGGGGARAPHPPVGTQLVGSYKQIERRCEVVETDEGSRFKLEENGQLFNSPSAAAQFYTHTSGNRFWEVEEEDTEGKTTRTNLGRWQEARGA